MYTKKQCDYDLKNQLLNNKTTEQIGAWAHCAYYDNVSVIDPESNIRSLLLTLSIMEEGPEFTRSYEELEDIADRLIAGQDVML